MALFRKRTHQWMSGLLTENHAQNKCNVARAPTCVALHVAGKSLQRCIALFRKRAPEDSLRKTTCKIQDNVARAPPCIAIHMAGKSVEEM